jgi:hypothetical protein
MSGSDELAKAIAAFRTTAEAALAQQMAEARIAALDSHEVIRRARLFMKESGLGQSACRVFEAGKWAVSLATIPRAFDITRESNAPFDSSLAFTRDRKRWRFQLKEHKDYLGEATEFHGELTVATDSKEVLTLAVHKSFDDYSEWTYSDVLSLALGQWAVELVEMDVEVKAEAQRRSEQTRAEMAKEHAKRLTL